MFHYLNCLFPFPFYILSGPNFSVPRNEVFSDPRTLISKNSGNRELEQAVRFLHDNGTMLHFEDPLLNDFYFVDPQWLCDMLAHIVTVREINPFVKDGNEITLLYLNVLYTHIHTHAHTHTHT